MRPARVHRDTTTNGKVFGEHTRPRVWSATPTSLTSGSGFSEGAEPRTRGRVRSPKPNSTRGVVIRQIAWWLYQDAPLGNSLEFRH